MLTLKFKNETDIQITRFPKYYSDAVRYSVYVPSDMRKRIAKAYNHLKNGVIDVSGWWDLIKSEGEKMLILYPTANRWNVARCPKHWAFQYLPYDITEYAPEGWL